MTDEITRRLEVDRSSLTDDQVDVGSICVGASGELSLTAAAASTSM